MCGIHVAIRRSANTGSLPTFLHHCLCNRGPDYFGQVTTPLRTPNSSENKEPFLTFTSTVLSLRGDHVTKQPFQDCQTGSVLCWNGEAWKIDGRTVQGNDGEAVFALLSGAAGSGSGSSDAILEALRSIEGPFAFVYFDAPSSTLYFGRDRLGRRSLLICHNDTEGSLVISSIAETCDDKWKEVEADGVYSMALHGNLFSSPYVSPSRHDWLPGTGSEFVSFSCGHNRCDQPVKLTSVGIKHWQIQHRLAYRKHCSFVQFTSCQFTEGSVDSVSQSAGAKYPRATCHWICIEHKSSSAIFGRT